jgi:peptide chain release factor 1
MAEEKNTLLTKLDEIESRYNEIERQLADPAIATDSVKLVALSKEQGKLKTTVAKYREYKKTVAGLEEAEHILKDSTADEDFKNLAKEEVGPLEAKKKALLEELQNILLSGDEMGIDSIIMEIRAGTGGEEAALFARDLYNMYTKYVEGRKLKIENLSFSTAEMGGFREVIFGIKGDRKSVV